MYSFTTKQGQTLEGKDEVFPNRLNTSTYQKARCSPSPSSVSPSKSIGARIRTRQCRTLLLTSSPSVGEDTGGGEDSAVPPHPNLPPPGGKGNTPLA